MTNLHLQLPFTSQQPAAILPENRKDDACSGTPGFRKTPENRRSGAGRGGVIPPPEHRWQKGCKSPNPGGRPRILTEKMKAYLEQKDENGITNAEKVVEAMGALAQKQLPHSVSAFREIRQIVESADNEEKSSVNVGSLNLEVLAMLDRLLEE
jgi:hypothetical protein